MRDILLYHAKTKQSIKTNDWILHFINFYSNIFRIWMDWDGLILNFFLWNVWRILSIVGIDLDKICVCIL